MEMVLTLVVYIITSLLVGYLGWRSFQRETRLIAAENHTLPFWSWEIIVSIGLFVIVFGLRYDTGNDYLDYLYQYNGLRDGTGAIRWYFEKGFLWFTMLLSKCHVSYYIYMCFWTLLQVGALYYALRERKFLFMWLGALLILGPYSFDWLTFLRQWTVAMVFVAVVPLIIRKKFWLYLACVLLLMSVHKTAVLLIPLYWIGYLQPADGHFKRRPYFLLLGLCTFFSLRPYWIYLLSGLQPLLDLCGYGRYCRQWNIVMSNFPAGLGITPTFMVKLVVACFLIYFYPQVRKRHSHDKLFPIYFPIAMIGLLFSILVNNLPILLERPVNLNFIFVLICSGYVLDYLFHEKKRWLMLAFLAILCSTYVIIVTKYLIDPGLIGGDKVYYHFMHLF